jgi:hypothetical protein
MKNFKKAMLAAALVTVSNHSFAEDVANTTIGQLDSLEQQIQFESKMNALEQLKLQRKQTQESLSEDKFTNYLAQREAELKGEFSVRENELLTIIDKLKSDIKELHESIRKRAYEESDTAEGLSNNVYVTSITGVGSNLIATIYHNEMISKLSAGAPITDNVSISRVENNGIYLTDGEKERFVALTNEKFAFSKTFNKEAAKVLQNQSMGVSLRR